jgi:hypothetical protein
MKDKKSERVKEEGRSVVSGSVKSLFMELNNQLQNYLDALKTASSDHNSN